MSLFVTLSVDRQYCKNYGICNVTSLNYTARMKTKAKQQQKQSSNNCANRLSQRNLSLLLDGVAKLLLSQQQFAAQLGIELPAELPRLTESELANTMNQWLRNGKDGQLKIQQLITTLYHHQLGLIEGLDGVVLQTIDHFSVEKTLTFKQRLAKLLQKDHKQPLQDYKADAQLRYQHIIAPGLVDHYLITREKLLKERK